MLDPDDFAQAVEHQYWCPPPAVFAGDLVYLRVNQDCQILEILVQIEAFPAAASYLAYLVLDRVALADAVLRDPALRLDRLDGVRPDQAAPAAVWVQDRPPEELLF